MTEYRSVLERAGSNAPPPDLQLERILRRRDRRRRNQRLAAGAVGIAVFVAMVPIVTNGLPFLHTGTPAGPGSSPTNQPSSGPVLSAIDPVPDTDYLLDLNTGETTPLPETIVGYAGPHRRLCGLSRRFEARLRGTGRRRRAPGLHREPRRDRRRAGDQRWSRDESGLVSRWHEDRVHRQHPAR